MTSSVGISLANLPEPYNFITCGWLHKVQRDVWRRSKWFLLKYFFGPAIAIFGPAIAMFGGHGTIISIINPWQTQAVERLLQVYTAATCLHLMNTNHTMCAREASCQVLGRALQLDKRDGYSQKQGVACSGLWSIRQAFNAVSLQHRAMIVQTHRAKLQNLEACFPPNPSNGIATSKIRRQIL